MLLTSRLPTSASFGHARDEQQVRQAEPTARHFGAPRQVQRLDPSEGVEGAVGGGGGPPELDHTVCSSGEKQRRLVGGRLGRGPAEVYGCDRSGMRAACFRSQLTCRQVPELQAAVRAAGGQQRAVRREGHGGGGPAGAEDARGGGRRHVPQHCSLLRSHGHELAARVRPHRLHVRPRKQPAAAAHPHRVEHTQRGVPLEAPKQRLAVGPRGHEVGVDGAPVQGPDRSADVREHTQASGLRNAPQTHSPIWTTGQQQLRVQRKRSAECASPSPQYTRLCEPSCRMFGLGLPSSLLLRQRNMDSRGGSTSVALTSFVRTRGKIPEPGATRGGSGAISTIS
mmetsp:Transcript_128869/g.412678  ORF Transcript_128869/g.412678 Transcript_128869/m.412678 type:complete len:339 (+) Transcript_128869:11-1027(+)